LTLLLLVTVAVGMVAPAVVPAEPVSPYFYVSPMGGYTFFRDALVLKDNLYAGGRIGYQYLPWLAIEAAGGYVPTQLDTPAESDLSFWHASGNILLSPWANPYVTPYVFVGGGYDQYRFKNTSDAEGYAEPGKDEFHFGTGEFGAGARFWFNDMLGIVVEGRGIADIPKNDMFKNTKIDAIVASAGITVAFGGKPRDTDGDGVSDRKDKCPDTPRGATVDATGCPLDSDGDGVFDGLDKCPNTTKGCTVNAAGCQSDEDGDFVCDGLDQCPNTPKGCTVDAKGCPSDADGDGVCDGLDQCANSVSGCTVDAKGCATDSDNDGVCDGLDKCPGTAAGLKVDADGCPIEIVERETELLDTGMIRLQDVNFETGKANVLPESYPALDVVGQVLTRWPELRIEVGGHTDSRGSAAYNLKLSEARAQSVLDYLKAKFPGLKAEQFTVKGYGESKPLVPNSSALNMAKNRRVEFKVLNKDVLKKEVERRQMLQK
jgi:outer membrane protein OmpA-like peptidoglycan-associated protein